MQSDWIIFENSVVILSWCQAHLFCLDVCQLKGSLAENIMCWLKSKAADALVSGIMQPRRGIAQCKILFA